VQKTFQVRSQFNRQVACAFVLVAFVLAGPLTAQIKITASPTNNPRIPESVNQPPNNQPSSNPPPATNQQPPLAAPLVSQPNAPTSDAVQSRIQSLQSNTDMDPTLKASLTAIYEAVLVELRAKAESERVANELAASAEAAPTATQEAKRRKESPPTNKDIPSKEELVGYSIEDLQTLLQSVQSSLQTISDNRARVETAITTRENRRKEIPRLSAEDKELLRKLTDELAAPPTTEIEPLMREAQGLLLQARRDAVQERIRKMEAEQRAYDAEAELLPLRKEWFQVEEKFLQGQLKDINDELKKRREILITNEKLKVEKIATTTPSELQPTAQRIVKRANDWLELAKSNSAIQIEIESTKARLALWNERFKIMSERIKPQNGDEVGGFNSLVGLMLRRQRSELPDISKLTNQLHDYQERMQQTETLILELDDWKAQLAAQRQDVTLSDGMSGEEQMPLPQSGNLRENYEKLIDTETELISNFRVDATNFFENLFMVAEAKQQTINLVKNYRAFVDQHVLWIRSSERLDKGELKQAWPALQWLCQFSNWKKIYDALIIDSLQHPWWPSIAGILWIALVLNLKKLRRTVLTCSEQVSRSSMMSFLPTFETTLISFALALPVPVLLLYIGWRLELTAQQTSFEQAVSIGLLTAARYFYPLEVLRQICRRNGLAEAHFGWSDKVTRVLRQDLRWLIDVGSTLVGIVAAMAHAPDEKWDSSLGRVCFAVLMLVCSIFLFRVFRPNTGVFSNHLNKYQGGWADRLRFIWYFGLALAPLSLLILALLGYYYTSQKLAMHFHTSVMTLVGLLLLHHFLMRWFTLSRRKLIVAQAKQRLDEAQKRDPSITSTTIFEPQVDLAESNAQTKRLITSAIVLIGLVGILFIWSGVMPAIGVLNTIKLWSVAGETPDKPIPITLANVLLAIPILTMMVVAARNLPGLLEIALLQHLPLENAVRYAIATLSRYAILLLGIAMTFNSLGVRWSSIQWLVAALGVGLGFGLQEIFANFVSGLILLFEQPIRVGDIITLGDVTGSVSRIRMRATTITNWDRQELIIPNKDLVTGRLLNWTLTDTTNRVKLTIGVAYGSNTDRACSLMTEICTQHPNVLSDPPPSAFFEDFAESTLQLTVRLFLGNLEQRLQTRHEIVTEIDRRFREEGIEIAFPQRDLRIRSWPPSIAGTDLTPTQSASKSSVPPVTSEVKTSLDLGS
jgi:potassium-dependent mechanosensitive channel